MMKPSNTTRFRATYSREVTSRTCDPRRNLFTPVFTRPDSLTSNACTMTTIVFRWHGKKEFRCHIHFSFSHGIEKQIWILLFVFRFRLTLKNGFELRISFFVFASLWKTDINFSSRFPFSVFASPWKTDINFVFRFRITLKNGLEFRFSFSHHHEKQIWISFVILAWLEKGITAPVQSFEAPATPSGLTGAFTFYVTESKWIFPSPGPKWVVNSAPPLPQWYVLHTQGTPFFNNGWQMIWW